MRYRVTLVTFVLLAGCADSPLPVEAAQAAFAACVPHDGLDTFRGSWNGTQLTVYATCKSKASVTVPLVRKQIRYELMT